MAGMIVLFVIIMLLVVLIATWDRPKDKAEDFCLKSGMVLKDYYHYSGKGTCVTLRGDSYTNERDITYLEQIKDWRFRR